MQQVLSICHPVLASSLIINISGKYVSAVLHDMAKSGGQAQAASLWASSGLQWSDFLQETPLDQFLKDNKLEWTMKVCRGDISYLNLMFSHQLMYTCRVLRGDKPDPVTDLPEN